MFTRTFVYKVEPAVSYPKCKDSVVTQLAWDQALKWSGVKKKIGEQSKPDAIHPLLVRSMTVNKWVMNIDKKILKCMKMLLKLMHSSVKNVFDQSHNLIGMLLTYVLQDNKLQVGQWVASTQSPQPPSPPLPHTDLFFSPRPCLASFAPQFPLTPQPSWEPVRRLSLNGCDIFKLYLDLI